MSLKKRLVIIGAGFGGLNLARKVDKRLYDVVIVEHILPLAARVARPKVSRLCFSSGQSGVGGYCRQKSAYIV